MFDFLNIKYYSGPTRNVLDGISKIIKRKNHGYICVTGAHGTVLSQKDGGLRSILNNASYNVTDGMPLVWIGQTLGHKETRRIYGPDFTREVCKLAQAKGYKMFFYGSDADTVDKLKHELKKQFKQLKIAGSLCPPPGLTKPPEDQAAIKQINKTGAQIIFIGLSTPLQEKWIYKNLSHLSPSVLIGVGAAFDFLAKTKPQAPGWMQKSGLEWLFRMVNEPRRLTGRYLINNTLFIFYTIKWFLRKK